MASVRHIANDCGAYVKGRYRHRKKKAQHAEPVRAAATREKKKETPSGRMQLLKTILTTAGMPDKRKVEMALMVVGGAE